jgi:HAE1 family hydrophobic/amphiphilic exporter-1
LQINSPQVVVDIQRDRAQSLGVTADVIQNSLYSAFGDRLVSTIYTQSNQYQVILEVLPDYQLNPAALSRLYVHASGGKMVPLSAVATLKPGAGPLTVNHSGQLPSSTVSFDLRPGFSIGEAAEAVQQVVRDLNISSNISVSFQGAMQAFQESFFGLTILLMVAVLVIYLVLGILYESFVHPLTILSGLPAAVVGALLTLKLFHLDLNLYAMVGLIMLFGIVKKNAIMMIDFALAAQRHEGKSPYDAICEGCRLRFRPIMMTTMSALFGTLPIALAFGAGAEARRPLGLAVIGGLLVSQLLTLYITPVIYLYMEGLRSALKRRKSTSARTDSPRPGLREHHIPIASK